MRTLPGVGVCIVLMITVGCATIPPEAPSLSAELGKRIQQTQIAHQALVRMYIDEKRVAVDRFLMQEWVPVFTKTLFEKEAVARAWDEVVRQKDRKLRQDFIVGLGPRLQSEINAKRLELIRPLDEIERGIIRRLEDSYNEMLAANATLTGLLAATSKASETQGRLLRTLGLEQKLPEYLDKADTVVRLIVEERDAFEKNRANIEALVNAVKNPR